MTLELDVFLEPEVKCPWMGHDPSVGLSYVVFGTGNGDDCELLRQLADELDLDLNLIKYPEGHIFNEEDLVGIQTAIMFFDRILSRLQNRPRIFITCKYENGYVRNGMFAQDLRAMVDYLRCCQTKGAKHVRFAVAEGPGNLKPGRVV